MKGTARQYAAAWYEALNDESDSHHRSALSRAMLAELHQQGKLRLLPQILRNIEALELDAENAEHVTVRTARHIDEAQLEKTVASLFPKKKIRLDTVVEPSLIGGAQIETADSRWDLSVSAELRRLAKTINE